MFIVLIDSTLYLQIPCLAIDFSPLRGGFLIPEDADLKLTFEAKPPVN